MIYEGMGVARGRAKVRFGGNEGKEIESARATSRSLPSGTGLNVCGRAPISS